MFVAGTGAGKRFGQANKTGTCGEELRRRLPNVSESLFGVGVAHSRKVGTTHQDYAVVIFCRNRSKRLIKAWFG